MRIYAETVGGAWEVLLETLLRAPKVFPRGIPCFERIGVHIEIADATANVIASPTRNLNYRFLVAEWLWIALGRNDVTSIANYNTRIATFSDDGIRLSGAYGPHIASQWPLLVSVLKRDRDSRQAVIDLWDDLPLMMPASKDVPCTTSLQFLVRDEHLEMIATMRSSDAWLGFPYDVFMFSRLGAAMAGELGVDQGSLILNLGSSHLYEVNRRAALDVIASRDVKALVSPSLPGPPPPRLNRCLEQPGAYAEIDGWTDVPPVYRDYVAAMNSRTSADALAMLRLLPDLHK